MSSESTPPKAPSSKRMAAKTKASRPLAKSVEEQRFGTFAGVFTPCTLTILGVIMFLRFGHVVGQAGLLQALAIVLAAKVITVLTSFSLSAIATNTRVKGGGAYFLISRSLGVEYGGAIGLVFFLAQAISVAMYVIGFSEYFLGAFPTVNISLTTLASIVNVVIFCCVMIGAGWAIKVQYAILVILVLSLVSFFAGALDQVSIGRLTQNLSSSYSADNKFLPCSRSSFRRLRESWRARICQAI